MTVVLDEVHVTYATPTSRPQVGQSGALRNLAGRVVGRTDVETVDALRGVSLVVREGEVLGLIGKNGSGKSTLLRAVSGLVTPTRGCVYVRGEARLVGVGAALLPDLAGDRNVVLGSLALGLTPKEVKQSYQDIVDLAGLGDAIYRPMRTYSSGMGARLRFAIATARAPDVLLVDEALATGDAEFRAQSEARLERLREEAGTIFFVSHTLSAVDRLCTRAVWLDGGLVRMDGDPVEVTSTYRRHYALQRVAREQGNPDPDMPGPVRAADSRRVIADALAAPRSPFDGLMLTTAEDVAGDDDPRQPIGGPRHARHRVQGARHWAG